MSAPKLFLRQIGFLNRYHLVSRAYSNSPHSPMPGHKSPEEQNPSSAETAKPPAQPTPDLDIIPATTERSFSNENYYSQHFGRGQRQLHSLQHEVLQLTCQLKGQEWDIAKVRMKIAEAEYTKVLEKLSKAEGW